MGNRNKYNAVFKENAVKLSFNSSKSIKEVADDLGVSVNMLYKWRRQGYTSQEEKIQTAIIDEESKSSKITSIEKSEQNGESTGNKKPDGVWEKIWGTIERNYKQIIVFLTLLSFVAYIYFEWRKMPVSPPIPPYKENYNSVDNPPKSPHISVDIGIPPVIPEEKGRGIDRDVSSLAESNANTSKAALAITEKNTVLENELNINEEEKTALTASPKAKHDEESKGIMPTSHEKIKQNGEITNDIKTDEDWTRGEIIALLTLFATLLGRVVFMKKKPVDSSSQPQSINPVIPDEDGGRDIDISNLIESNANQSKVSLALIVKNTELEKKMNIKDEKISAQTEALEVMREYVIARDEEGLTPLMIAIKNNSKTCKITALINSDEDVNARDKYGRTALMIAAGLSSNLDVITVLVNNGAEINAVFKNEYTALMFAAFNNHNPEVINTLVKAGSITDGRTKDGDTVLMIAAAGNNNPDVITALIKNDADVNAKNKDGWTALMFAAKYNSNPDVITALIKGKADTKAIAKYEMTVLMIAAGVNINPDVVTVLIENGANVNARTETENTALMIAAANNNNPDVITALIRKGADVNARNKYGDTALMLAAEKNSNFEVIITALIKGGVDVNARGEFEVTALMDAAMRNSNPDVITALVKNGADVNAITEAGFTALMFAAGGNSNPDVITTLIENGADVTIKSNEGKRALDYAEENENLIGTEAYNLLRQKTP
jgi:ankyrin repeat protein/transposase-like protein